MNYYRVSAFTLCLFFTCLISGDLTAQGRFYKDLIQQNFKGPVKSYTETPYRVDSSGQTGEMMACCIAEVDYDSNGNHLKTITVNSGGVVQQEQLCKGRYPNGLSKGDNFMVNGKIKSFTSWNIDANGHYVTGESYDSSGARTNHYSGFRINEFGQDLAFKLFDKNNTLILESEREYDKHLLIKRTDKDSVGRIRSRSAYKYNDSGELVETTTTSFLNDQPAVRITRYTYESHDTHGNWTQRTTRDANGKALRISKRIIRYRI